MSDRRSPFLLGTVLALAAAAAFGLSAPLVQRFGRGLGPFVTAGLLYSGAVLVSVGPRAERDAAVRARHWPRLALAAFFGAFVAPASLAFALQRASGTDVSLLLNLEVAFTALLAALLLREHLGRRVALAMAVMSAGAVLLVQKAGAGTSSLLGLAAVGVATLAWAIDNVTLRPLADSSPSAVVLRKALLGALASFAVATLRRESTPTLFAAAALLACGALGTGLSLRLYLLAQRKIGAARTASLFSLAPFVGALAAWGMGQGSLGFYTLLAAGCFALGAYLHLTEQHEHEHTHEALLHEHAHRHDDGHHQHTHEPPVTGTHSHVHAHERVTHRHPHTPDLHHKHRHG